MSETLNSLASRTAGDCASLIEQEGLETWHERSEGMCPVILTFMQKAVAAAGRELHDFSVEVIRDKRVAELERDLAAEKDRHIDTLKTYGDQVLGLRHELTEARRKAMVEAASVAWDAIAECAEDNHDTWKPETLAHDVQEHVNNRILDAARAQEGS